MEGTDLSHLDAALALVPSGRYLMTAQYEGARAGLVVHSLTRVGQDPPMLCVAGEKGHAIDPLIRDARAFAVGVIDDGDRMILRRFSMRVDGDTGPCVHVHASDPFDAIKHTTLVTGAPMPEQCATWFECELSKRIDLDNETELFVGRVVGVIHGGAQTRLDPEL